MTDDTLTVDLSDGRTISVPLAWYPRLVHASENERMTWRLIGRGEGIHWPELDEDISVEALIAEKALGREPAIFREIACRTRVTAVQKNIARKVVTPPITSMRTDVSRSWS